MPKSIPFAISFHFSRFHFSCVPVLRLHRHRNSNEINVHVLIRHTTHIEIIINDDFANFSLISARSHYVLCTYFIWMICNANWLFCARVLYNNTIRSLLHNSFMHCWQFDLLWFFVICFLIINSQINYYREKYPFFEPFISFGILQFQHIDHGRIYCVFFERDVLSLTGHFV